MGEALEKEEDWPENVFRKRRKQKCKFNAFCFSRAAYVFMYVVCSFARTSQT